VAYLDHAATAPLRPEVAEAMAPWLGGRFGNPSGAHRVARLARRAVDEAREVVAEFLGAGPGDVVFTAGGTEADNLALLGTLAARWWPVDGAVDGAPDGPPAVVCSAVEHAAVLETARAATRPVPGWPVPPVELRLAPVDQTGAVDPDRLEALLDRSVVLVSVMAANNEVGTLQPLDEVARRVRRSAPGAVFHTDAVQAAPWLDLAQLAAGADLVAVSGHKLGGPQGVGALAARTRLAPVLHGGGQERGLRSGTHFVAGIVGLAAACTAVAAGRRSEAIRVAGLRDRLAEGISAAVPSAVESAPRDRVLPGHLHLRFAGVEQEELVLLLDQLGVCASAGAACASGAVEESHVMAAMGVPAAEARGAVRFSLGWSTGPDDVDRAVAAVASVVGRLRAA
jgi:cysteine desulfurase